MNLNTILLVIFYSLHSTLADECGDIRNDCERLQAQGWCEKRPNTMKKLCGITCNLCDEAAVVTQEPRHEILLNSCQNVRDDCSLFKEAGWCEKKKNTMLKLCGPTCNFCKEGEDIAHVTIATTTTTTIVKPMEKGDTCINKRSDCDRLAKVLKLCLSRRRAMTLLCSKSCNFCESTMTIPTSKMTTSTTMTSTTTSTTTTSTTTTTATLITPLKEKGCQDVRSDCHKLGIEYNWCVSKSSAMEKICAKTCNYCTNVAQPVSVAVPEKDITRPPPATTNTDSAVPVCKDVMDGCSFMLTRGWCKHRKDQIKDKCRKTCGFCDTCSDHRDDCFQYKSNGWCESKPDVMVNVCARTCNLCNNVPTAAKPIAAVCQDQRTTCYKMKNIGFCESRQKVMEEVCPATCGFCIDTNPNKIATTIPPTTTTTTVARVAGCKDDFGRARCEYYAHIGWCNKYERIKKNCQDTCECNFKSFKKPETQTHQECDDSSHGCCEDNKTKKRDAEGSNCPVCSDDKRFVVLCGRFGGDCGGSGSLAKSLHKYCQKTCKLCCKMNSKACSYEQVGFVMHGHTTTFY